MRWTVLVLAVACGKAEDSGEPVGGGAPLDLVAGLEEALAEVGRTGLTPSVAEVQASCVGADWEARVGVNGTATAVVAVLWDVRAHVFSGAWSLSADGQYWDLSATAAEIGLPCDGRGASTLVFFPLNGDLGGEPAGISLMDGENGGCGYTAIPEPSLFFSPTDADEAGWRVVEAYRGEESDGPMSADGMGWSATIADPGFRSAEKMPPLMGMWGASGGVATASCVL